jgi:hypothetical protein
MRRIVARRHLLWALIPAAAAIGALVVSPALGGPSLKKLVKKEVARQIGKASGPQGPQGLTGLQGVPGPAGPTFAATIDAQSPPPTTEAFSGTLTGTISTPTEGKLLVMANANDLEIDCTGGGQATFGVYLDGAGVPGTGGEVTSPGTTDLHTFGVTAAAVPAGIHTLSVGGLCPNAMSEVTFSGGARHSVGAVLLGS